MAFTALVGILIRITSFAVQLKICAITAWIKKYKPIKYQKKEEAW